MASPQTARSLSGGRRGAQGQRERERERQRDGGRQTDRESQGPTRGSGLSAWPRALAAHCPPRPRLGWGPGYLDGKGAQHNGAENRVPEDAIKDVALAVDLAGVDLVEELHHDEGVEDDGVVL